MSLISSQKILTKISLFNNQNDLVCLLQKCNAGFFRTLSGECVPCDCNGNSNECLDGSGFCVVSWGTYNTSHTSLGICTLGEDKIFFGCLCYIGANC